MKLIVKIVLAFVLLLTGFFGGCLLTSYWSISADLSGKLRFHDVLAADDAETRLQEAKLIYRVQLPYLTCQTYTFYRSGFAQLGLATEQEVQLINLGFATLGVNSEDETQRESYCEGKSLPLF